MSSVQCRWVSHMLAKPPSEYWLEHEKHAVDAHLEHCASCANLVEITRLLEQIQQVELPQASPFLERKIVSAALEGRMPHKPKVRFFRKEIALGIVAVGAAVAGIVLMLNFLFTAQTSQQVTHSSPMDSQSTARAPRTVANGDSRKAYNLFHFDASPPLKLTREDKVWGVRDTIVNIEVLSKELTKLELLRGKIVARVTHRHSGEKFIVAGPMGSVEVVGTVFSVEVDDTGAQIVRVLEGKVKVTDAQSGAIYRVAASQQLTIGAGDPIPALASQLDKDRGLMRSIDSGSAQKEKKISNISKAGPAAQRAAKISNQPVVNSVDLASQAIDSKRLFEAQQHIEQAKESATQNVPGLLARLARAYRQQKNYAEAKDTYEQLIRDYSWSPAAQNAMVALGQLELNVLDKPREAQSHFEEYLQIAPGGYLSEEAWIGKARALSREHRNNELLQTATQYLDMFPTGSFASEALLYRGNSRLQFGDCRLAQKDYQTIIERWPASPRAKEAQKGLDKCASNIQ